MASGSSEAELLIVVDNLLEFIGINLSLLETEYVGLGGVSDLLQNLKKWIEERRGKLEKLVISSIREFVREVEEVIELCVALERRIKRKTQMQSYISGLQDDINDILKKFHVKDFERLGSKLFIISKQNDKRWNDKALFVVDDDKHPVGRRDEIEKVSSVLMKICNVFDGNLEVISITGMVGLGKTELAVRIFKSGTVSFMFSLRAFISVPRDYSKNKKMVFIEILRQFGKEEKISRTEESELVKMLGNFLNSSNFLIVLDDVGSLEVVDDIRSSMAAAASQQQGNQQRKSKGVLLITARGRKSAVGMGLGYSKNGYILGLRPLKTEESRELLRMETFGKNECPVGFGQCETKIVEKCYGLPLAIVSFARILTKHREKIQWWNKVADNFNVFTKESQINKAMRSILEELNDNLKLCFLYLGVFERGAHIPVSVLLRLWMAEGLVRNEESQRRIWTEEVAENYLEELVERSLVMVSKRRTNGKIKAIKIHDGVLDFCISEAKEGNLFKESFFSETSRRFCVRNSVIVSNQFYSRVPTSNPYPVQSILYNSDVQMNLSNGELFYVFLSSFVPKTFKFLKVLDVRSFVLTKLPAQLFSLFLLRYMAISCNSSFLPKELSNLRYLETLIVRTSSGTETLEIRADILDMEILGHLKTNKPILLKGKSTNDNSNSNSKPVNQNLRTISKIFHKNCTKEFFKRTPNLKKLTISFYFQEPSTSNKKWVIFKRLFSGNGSHKEEEDKRVEELKQQMKPVEQQLNSVKQQLLKVEQQHQQQQVEQQRLQQQVEVEQQRLQQQVEEQRLQQQVEVEQQRPQQQVEAEQQPLHLQVEQQRLLLQRLRQQVEQQRLQQQVEQQLLQQQVEHLQEQLENLLTQRRPLQEQRRQLQRPLLQQKYLNFFGHLAELNSLENLKVLNEGSHLKCPLPLDSRTFPECLSNLTLLNTYLDQANMFIIGKMLNLETLKLQSCEFEGNSWETKEGGFLKLKVLHIRNTNLHRWKASWNHFPMLTTLSLFFCEYLQNLPVGVSGMQTLQAVKFCYGHSKLAQSLKTELSNKQETQPGFELTILP